MDRYYFKESNLWLWRSDGGTESVTVVHQARENPSALPGHMIWFNYLG